jgi:MscS family membrane protein
MAFLQAARAGENTLAARYLNTKATGQRAETLAQNLFVVLDARLPARLWRISDTPEGSGENPMAPNQEVVGTVDGPGGAVDIVVERVDRGDPGLIWLFSSASLEAIPAVYDDVVASRHANLPVFLTKTRVGGFRLVDWLAALIGLPIVYLATILLNRLLTPVIGRMRRRMSGEAKPVAGNALPAPARLLLASAVGGWLLSALPLSLPARQLWSNAVSLITIGAVVWLLVLLNGRIEDHIRRKIPRSTAAAGSSLLRLARRAVDVLVLFGGFIALLRHFGIDPTPALAGLGVGGIAVALAAQKTLENVIAGASLIFDQAVRVGDFLKMGDVQGTVDHIGLRSTRIRTLDRTVVSIPNGQIANVSLETLSARDKFWFHPVVPLRFESTPEQLRSVVDGIRQLLDEHPSVDSESVRVRFFRLGSFSLDIDVFAYLYAHDWNHFLEIQEQLLFDVTDIVSRSGTWIAFPSQTMYVAGAPASIPSTGSVPVR